MQTFKPVSKFGRILSILLPRASLFQLQTATLVMLGILGFFGAIATSWLLGESTISAFFAQLHFWQENPPIWIQVPQVSHPYYLLVPTAVLFLLAQGIMKLSPQPQTWARTVVVTILLALTVRYVLWRSLTTLNLANPLDGVFSLGLFLIEILIILFSSIQLYLNLKVKHRYQEADRMSIAVIQGEYTPSVDIFIPTYNEPEFILRRTILGCQGLEYANKKIYLLDDKRRDRMRSLAYELGCEYITRPDNRHAKAGNLNHALPLTSGELVVVFDSDFIPTKNFLTRTVGFFQNPQIALVQTHKSFYNRDPIARNLGLEKVLTEEEEITYRYQQLLRDAIATVVCCGTSFVVRRSALEEVGGFVTDSLCEDYFTGINLSSKGYRVIYLGESLSAGLSAENIADFMAQRMRWTRGTLQGFFIKANPLTIPGLQWVQRLGHFDSFFFYFTPIFRVIFLLMPIVYSLLRVVPYQLNIEELLYFFVPFYVLQLSTFSWLNSRSRSALLSDIYTVAQCFPLALTAIQTMFSPFSKGFRVTPKGTSSDRFTYNWTLALPLIVVLLLTIVSFGYYLFSTLGNMAGSAASIDGKLIGGIIVTGMWSVYNLLIIGIALLIMLDVPKPDIYDWLPLRRGVKLTSANGTVWGMTTELSEGGAEIELRRWIHLDRFVTLEIPEEGLTLPGKITHSERSGKFPRVRVMFEPLSLSQHRRLVEILFCRPGQWTQRETPGELRSLWILLTVLLKPLNFIGKKKILAVTKNRAKIS
ncbi:glycosyltransferase [Pleurocapsales cyanobacterium LEGE 06147]|nr:glycosyltransferase [Pleurocapsales cyanobacterium LEGE 06147]